jgi:hypothetical protein
MHIFIERYLISGGRPLLPRQYTSRSPRMGRTTTHSVILAKAYGILASIYFSSGGINLFIQPCVNPRASMGSSFAPFSGVRGLLRSQSATANATRPDHRARGSYFGTGRHRAQANLIVFICSVEFCFCFSHL